MPKPPGLQIRVPDENDVRAGSRRNSGTSLVTPGPLHRASSIGGSTRSRRSTARGGSLRSDSIIHMTSPAASIEEMNATCAAATLRTFKFFQEMEIGVQQRLPGIVHHVIYEAGLVLFRQGDPPGNCYVVLSGSVGILVKDVDNSPVSPENSRTPKRPIVEVTNADKDAPDPREASALEVPSAGVALSRPPTAGLSRPPDEKVSILPQLTPSASASPTYRTAEGFSTYSEGEDLGAMVGQFGSGSIFGELALMEDQPRSASVKCLQECEFLVIAKDEFNQVLKAALTESQLEKMHFLKSHVPGVRDSPVAKPGRPHVTYFFRKHSYPKGHEFLSQGSVHDDAIYIIYSGCVEFSRRELGSSMSSPSVLQSSKLPRPSSQGSTTRSASRGGNRERRRGRDPDESEDRAPGRQKMSVLLSGALFGSAPASGPEPFTVTAINGPCECYAVHGQDLRKLPQRLLDTVREYLMRATTWRLERLRSNRMIELKPAASVPEFSPWASTPIGLSLLQAGKLHTHLKVQTDLAAAHCGAQASLRKRRHMLKDPIEAPKPLFAEAS